MSPEQLHLALNIRITKAVFISLVLKKQHPTYLHPARPERSHSQDELLAHKTIINRHRIERETIYTYGPVIILLETYDKFFAKPHTNTCC